MSTLANRGILKLKVLCVFFRFCRMQGIVTSRLTVSQQLWTLTLNPETSTSFLTYDIEQSILQSRLQYEQDVLIDSITSTLEKFDADLRYLRHDKMHLEVAVKCADLRWVPYSKGVWSFLDLKRQVWKQQNRGSPSLNFFLIAFSFEFHDFSFCPVDVRSRRGRGWEGGEGGRAERGILRVTFRLSLLVFQLLYSTNPGVKRLGFLSRSSLKTSVSFIYLPIQ